MSISLEKIYKAYEDIDAAGNEEDSVFMLLHFNIEESYSAY